MTTLARLFAILPPRFNNDRSGYQCDKTSGGVEVCEFMEGWRRLPRGHGVHCTWYRNVVEMMMKRTVRIRFMFSSVKQMSLDSHSVLRHCCGSHFYLELREPIAHAKYDSRRGSRNTASVCWGNDDSSENEYTDER
jgi:hypothetical protein